MPCLWRFQIVEQHDPDDIIYSASYLGIQRMDQIVLIHIVDSDTRDMATKQALYASIADKLAAKPGLRREDVQVVISGNGRPDWCFGNGLASYVPAPG